MARHSLHKTLDWAWSSRLKPKYSQTTDMPPLFETNSSSLTSSLLEDFSALGLAVLIFFSGLRNRVSDERVHLALPPAYLRHVIIVCSVKSFLYCCTRIMHAGDAIWVCCYSRRYRGSVDVLINQYTVKFCSLQSYAVLYSNKMQCYKREYVLPSLFLWSSFWTLKQQ